MFKLYRDNQKMFQLVDDEQVVFLGTVEDTVAYLLDLGVLPAEVEYSMIELVSNDHNVAYFGINLTFMFSKAA